MKLPFALTVLFLFVVSSTWAEQPPTLPAYPGQPSINQALDQLTKAQGKIEGDEAEALIHLKKAALALEGSSNNKGSFRKTSIRVTNQAIKHLEQKDTATARKEIEEAIENTNKAGKFGAK